MSSTEISMETIMEDEDSFVSNTNAIIYATSDISGWTQSLILDNNIPNSSSISVDEHHNHHQQISTAAGGGGDDDDDDSMIVSSSASSSWFMNNQHEIRISNIDFWALCDNRLKSCPGSEFPGDTRLVNTLMACAEAIHLADELISDIRRLTVSQIGGAMNKVAAYFVEAFYHRIHRTNPRGMVEPSYSTNPLLHMCCPLLKVAHFTANQSILEAFASSKRVHVIDFSFNQGLQWSALLRALALRPGGPPAFRLSGICAQPKVGESSDPLQEVGFKLTQFAESIGVEFEFRGFMAHTLADLEASMLNIRSGNVEAVAVNSIFELHRLFSIPGTIEKVLDLIKEIQPKIVTIAEQEVNHNGCVFMDRINEAWHYYSTMFDVLENSATLLNNIDVLLAEQHLGWEIYNLVVFEGTKRVVRHETLGQWRVRYNSAGFNVVPVFKCIQTS